MGVTALLLISVLLSLYQCKVNNRALHKVFKDGQRFLDTYRLPWHNKNMRRNLQAVVAKPAPAAPAPVAKPAAPAKPAPVAPAAPAPAPKPAKVVKKPAKKPKAVKKPVKKPKSK